MLFPISNFRRFLRAVNLNKILQHMYHCFVCVPLVTTDVLLILILQQNKNYQKKRFFYDKNKSNG